MNRRDFLKMAATAGGYAMLSQLMPFRLARASSSSRVLLNITLDGGPDFRHLFVPPVETSSGSFGYAYWSHRYKAHDIGSSSSAWQNRYSTDYTAVTSSGTTFGILNKAGWLKDQIQAGRVAIISNVYGSPDRDHSRSQLVLESGDPTAGPNDLSRNGWGGRLAQTASAKLCSMTQQVRLFCNGRYGTSDLGHDNAHVISAKDSRNMGLAYPDSLSEDIASTQADASITRALRSYYDAKRDLVEDTNAYKKFFVHEKTFRDFGDAMNTRLDSVTLPTSISNLYEGSTTLNSTYFGQQMRNAYDCFVAQDLLNFRVGSLEYGGWDSHKDQKSAIEPNLEDLFGTGGGLDALMTSLASNFPTLYSNMVVTIAGEFGRQIVANGDGGTDHGRGNTMLVIGPGVNGGVYGEMFPTSEIARYDDASADIDGRTSFVRVFKEVCDWVESGSGAQVFSDFANYEVESGVSLEGLFV